MNFFEIDFDFNDLDVSFLSNLSEKAINEIHGLASGKFRLTKRDNKITHEGSLKFKERKIINPIFKC